ncbi:MAG: hypothetical protein P0Y53_10065 [Candidatus Pseudobacter hemicellulosilyticus]|uniref:Uncharacterized protein n=1 Tax=Candidatus Pseudobacter hemicellulosilyticus TaxID=3121375 RepID=A0AAJ5WYC1_9BACT|nr:MAG: hypothetical protein P0Y53_10065 [Pseudobacter sp.]
MKTTIKLVIAAACLLLAACNRNIDMTTVLNSDGSCDRILVAEVDEKFIQGDTSQQPFVMDLAGWEIQWTYKDSKRSSWPMRDFTKESKDSAEAIIAIARRHFNSVQQLADSFRIKSSHAWNRITIKPVLEKEFRFFYTYYHYKESFSGLPVKLVVPADKYLSAEEAGYWLTGKPDITRGRNGIEVKELLSSIEDRADKWFLRNLFEIQYGELLHHLELIANHPGKAAMAMEKDSVFAVYYADYTKSKIDIDLMTVLDKYFKTTAFGNFTKAGNDSLVQQINEPESLKGLFDYFDASIDYKLVMPGAVITSDGLLSHDTLSWKIDAYRLLYGDYTIEASSKKTNGWAFLTAAIILILAVSLFFVKRRPRH